MRLTIFSLLLLLSVWLLKDLAALPYAAKMKPTRSQSSATKSASAGKLEVAGGIGLGVFKDIQVPINEEEGTRGDGSVASAEFQDHSGIPLHLSVGYFFQGKVWQPFVGIDLLKMSSESGAVAAQSASYSRFNLLGGIDRRFGVSSYSGYWGLRTHARRSAFNNGSSGHHINAGLIGVAAGIESRKSFKVSSFASLAPVSTFAYHTSGFGGQKFKSATSEMLEFGLESSFHMHGSAWFDISAEQERALVRIGDVSEYDSFGLAVTPTAQSERVYDLITTVIKIGFRKNF